MTDNGVMGLFEAGTAIQKLRTDKDKVSRAPHVAVIYQLRRDLTGVTMSREKVASCYTTCCNPLQTMPPESLFRAPS
jgi:hypothetical protein